MSKLSTLLKTGARLDAAYIQSGVLAGPFYTSSEVSGGLPKPKYLQSAQNTNVLTIKTDSDNPLIVRFALGTDAGGAWQGATRTLYSDMTISLTGSSIIILQLDDPNDTSLPVSVLALSPVPNVTFSRTAPASPVGGDLWFSYDANWMKQYDAGTLSWENKNWTILGEVGVGADGYIYSMRSDYPHRGIADFVDSLYPNGSPWRHYDGVSFVTDGQYTASRVDQWIGDTTIKDAVTGNGQARTAVSEDAYAIEQFIKDSYFTGTVLENASYTANWLSLEKVGKAIVDHEDAVGVWTRRSGNTSIRIVTFGLTDGNSDGYIRVCSYSTNGIRQFTYLDATLDLTDISTLYFDASWTHTDTSQYNYSLTQVKIGATVEFSVANTTTSRTTNSIDVSGYAGSHTVAVLASGRNGHSSNIYFYNMWAA